MTSESQGLGFPCGTEFGCERVFVLKPPEPSKLRVIQGLFGNVGKTSANRSRLRWTILRQAFYRFRRELSGHDLCSRNSEKYAEKNYR